MRIMYALFMIVIFSGCVSGIERAEKVKKSSRTIKCMILFEEEVDGKKTRAGNSYSEEAAAACLPGDFHNTGRNAARTGAVKTGINTEESITGIIDPVIRDYLAAELSLDAVIIGKISVTSVGSYALIKAVSLKDGSTIVSGKFSSGINYPEEYNYKKELDALFLRIILGDNERFVNKIRNYFEE